LKDKAALAARFCPRFNRLAGFGVKSLFGADSPQYKQLTALKFKKP
jgi:hypothetical protein